MIKSITIHSLVLVLGIIVFAGCHSQEEGSSEVTQIKVYVDSVLNDVSNHPIGINLDYFTDDDNYLKPSRRTADALKAMGVKYLRYPGGNKSDFYFFSEPPYDRSKPTLARTGKGAVGGRQRMLTDYREFKVDVLDFDEFIEMCREVGAEPVICVAADEYLVDYPEGCTWAGRETLIEHAVEWVRYANIKKQYEIKYWMIGNESWHQNNKNSTAAVYARDVVDFSKAMKAVDPSIRIIPNGNSIEFFKDVLTIAAGHFDDLCLSNYPVWEYKAGYTTYRDTLQDLMGPVRRALTAIDSFASEEDRQNLKLIIAEYGPFDWGRYWPMINDMGHNLCNFEMTGEHLLAPEIEFSCFWNTRWINNDSLENSVYDALDKDGQFNAIGYGMMIWGNYLGDKMVKTTATVHIRSFASIIPDEKRMYVYLLNKAEEPRAVGLEIPGYEIKSVLMAKELVGENADDVDPVWRDNSSITNARDLNHMFLPETSISVIELDYRNL